MSASHQEHDALPVDGSCISRMISTMATYKFPIQPFSRFIRECQPVKRPKEFACFSYDRNHQFHLGGASLKWYYPPAGEGKGIDLSQGYENFDRRDDGVDEHLDSLLKAIMDFEKRMGCPIDAHVCTWRGMMTKIMAAPFDNRDGFEMNATLYRDCLFIEEHHEFRQATKRQEDAQPWKSTIPLEVRQFWGYKFETICTLAKSWAQVSRENIENRPNETVNNKEQYCSVVRTGIGQTILCLGGEIDCIWDSKPATPGAPVNWVELKTSAEIHSERDLDNFENKLLKYWIQSFLLGVPKIIVGFRDRQGKLQRLEEMQTVQIPDKVERRGKARWNANACINFTSAFLDWLRKTINDEGVWRISRQAGSPHISLVRTELTGHGNILSDEFMNWRIKLDLGQPKGELQQPVP